MSRHKYGAVATVVDGVRFSSKAEAARYQELRLLERAGHIKELELQPKYPIHACARQRSNGSPHQLLLVCHYIADFRYREGPQGVLVVEDVKGMRTPVYRLKKKLFELQYGIAITETGRPVKRKTRSKKAA